MANSWRYFASLIIFKLRKYHQIRSVNNNLAPTLRFHGIFEEQLLLIIDFSLNLVIFDLIVNYVIFDVFVLNIKYKATSLTSILCLQIDLTTFMKRACLDTHTILFSCFCQNTDFFVLPYNLILDLWGNCEVDFLFLACGEINMVWNLNITDSNIWYFYLYKNSLILYFLDAQFHINDLILLIARSGYDEGDVIEFMVTEFYRIQLYSRNVSSWARLCIFSLKSDRKW